MARLKGITLILICVCLLQHFLQASDQLRKRKGKQKQHIQTPKPTSPPRIPKKSRSKDPKLENILVKGKIPTRDGTRCTWAATESSTASRGTLVLSISCKNGTERSLQCEYTAKPRLCPEYTANVEAFWKQIGGSLKRQKTLCRDSKTLLKAKMCRKAPKRAHFALSTTPTVQPTSNKLCSNLGHKQKLAEEYCGSSWSSFCTFFFAMVETEDC